MSAKQGTTVIVENLFHNLPVRRRELERHVKREWAKVISLLNQYACIMTEVKFTVSQQPNKGKKIVMFSTKGNPTTRENIINIFGTKTMAAMIPLDLTLEMKPTSLISLQHQRRPLASYKVTVKGHISRPAHGEGRQAPDRQMFFVNGRPCGLPQLAKVFNEVYRAFNSSQSPFIFADIQLDTHLYDVNVSPDKRTVLLHDQGQMLESLRESLNSLFEAQDYSIPASQLATQKSASAMRSGVLQAIPGRAAPSPNPPITKCQAPRTPQNTYKVTAYEPSPESLPDSHGPTLHSVDFHATNPMSTWVQRQPSLEPMSGSSLSRQVSKEVDDESFQRDMDHIGSSSTPTEARPEAPALQIPEILLHEGETPKRVRNFHSRLDESKQTDLKIRPGYDNKEAQLSPSSQNANDDVDEFRLAGALTQPRKRAAPDVATVTIGDQSVTSLIGSSAKRHREQSSPSLVRPTRSHSQTVNPADTPSFGGRLSYLFSAHPKPSTETESEPQTGEVHGPIEDSNIGNLDENGLADKAVQEGEEPDEANASSTSELPESTEIKRAKDATHLATFQPLVPDNDIVFAKDAPDGTEDNGPKEPAPRQKMMGVASDRRPPAFKHSSRRKEPTFQCEQHIRGGLEALDSRTLAWRAALGRYEEARGGGDHLEMTVPEVNNAEEKLTLTISKGHFNKMKVIGQFNLGFILAVRPAGDSTTDLSARRDELFIIDQHASDEKYNFERLRSSTILQSQRLVLPKTLELTALEEEVVLNNLPALEANGFQVTVDESGDQPVGSRCQLLALPLSKETTFSLTDLEELISLLEESQVTSETRAIPRPSKVRKMFAMRACRSSIMIGNALQQKQMEKLVRHMGELDKPWNCPHGRPTMRHLCSLGTWDGVGWKDDQRPAISRVGRSWGEYLEM